MENCSQYDDLLAKYLLNELSEHERQSVTEWIDANPENNKYFNHFKAAWSLASLKHSFEVIDTDSEWIAIKNKVGQQKIIAPQYKLSYDNFDTENRGRGNLYKLLVAAAIAASVILVAGIGIFISKNQKTNIAKVSPERSQQDIHQAVPSQLKTEFNSSSVAKDLKLSDGSAIILYANSEVSYEEKFTGNTREIILKGKADFKVSKDKAKPFIVHTGDISITVLGTVFTVTAFERTENIRVKLYEGKVVVKSEDQASKKMIKDFYLVPGQELVYNNIRGSAFVSTFKNASSGYAKNRSQDDPSLPENNKGSWFMFNNQTLPDVFDQLQNIYNTPIVYSKHDIEKMYFIGKFDKSDSLDNILKNMALLYHLKIEKKDNKIMVTKL